MKTGLAFLMLLVLSSCVQASESSWLTNYGEALDAARTTARPLLLVISRDDLLPVSTDRSRSGEAGPSSHDLVDSYVLCKIDANSGYGKRVAEAYRVTEFPHSVIIDKTAKKILYSKAGRATDDALKATFVKYRQGEAVYQPAAPSRPQATVLSPSRSYGQSSSRAYGQSNFIGNSAFFRNSPFCNT